MMAVSGVARKKRTYKQGVCGAAAPLKLEMFSCRGWQKFMSGNCSFMFSMHNNWWMKTINSITASFDYIFFYFFILFIFLFIIFLGVFSYLFFLNRFDLKNVQHIRNSYIHWYNDPVELRLHGTRKKTIKREE